jgi:hypothetical protein
MKTALVLSLVLILCFAMSLQTYQPDRDEQLVNEIIAKTAKVIKKEYGLQPCGSGASMPGGPIRKINLCFDARSSYTKDQLRELLIKITEKMVSEVNGNEEVQKFLFERPFTEKNVQITIFNYDKDGNKLYDPDICGAQVSAEGLLYLTKDINHQFNYKNEFEESYEAALKLLKQ